MNSPAEYLAAAAAFALAGGGTYLRETAEQATIDTSTLSAPYIVCNEYSTSQSRPDSRVSAATITLYFADAVPGSGDDPVAHQAAVSRMELLKRRLLAALDQYPLAQIDGMKATPMTGIYAAALDGVGVQFTLTVPAAPLVVACL